MEILRMSRPYEDIYFEGYRTKSVSDIGPSAQAGGLFPWV